MMETKLQQIREHHAAFRKHIEETGNSLRYKELPVLTEEMFLLYEKTGNRLIYENEYFKRREFLVVFGLLVYWYKRPEDIEKLEEVLLEVCGEETWALPAHVDLKKMQWQREVDLFAAETGQTLANIIHLNKNYLKPEVVQRVKDMGKYRLLDSYMEVPAGGWRWEHFYNNWVAVCASCVGSAALFLLNDKAEQKKAIIERVCNTLPAYIEGMHDDGTCPEGMSYFTYGMTYFVGFERQLKEDTDGGIDLMDSEKVRNIARFQHKCYLPGGNTVSFSDGQSEDHYRLGLTCYLARNIEGVVIPDISAAMEFEMDHCYRFMGNLQDDIWVQEYLEAEDEKREEGEEWFTLLPQAQWAVWKKGRTGIAFKGGNNDEPHNHNDIGSFLLTVEGEVFLTDLGCGEYTKEYFQPDTRYDILCNRSYGHNVPIINGCEQSAGSGFHSEYFRSDCEGCVELSFAGAYEPGADWKLKRIVESYATDSIVKITDCICNADKVLFEERLVTQIEPLIQESQILLRGQKGDLAIKITEECASVQMKKEIFRNHRGKDEDVWLLTFPVSVREGKGKCQICCEYIKRKDGEEILCRQ